MKECNKCEKNKKAYLKQLEKAAWLKERLKKKSYNIQIPCPDKKVGCCVYHTKKVIDLEDLDKAFKEIIGDIDDKGGIKQNGKL